MISSPVLQHLICLFVGVINANVLMWFLPSCGGKPCLLFDIILQALIVKLKDPDPDPNPGVINNVLATIGELAQVNWAT